MLHRRADTLLLPLAGLINRLTFSIGRKMFDLNGLRVRRNICDVLTYILAYSVFLQPACLLGYLCELLLLKKSWGTKLWGRLCAVSFSVLVIVTGIQAANAAAADDIRSMAAGPTVCSSTDNESFHTRRTGVDFFPKVQSQEAATGVCYRHYEFSQDGWSKSGEQVSLVARGPLVVGVRAWQAEAGLMTEGRHTLLTMDGSCALLIAQGTLAETFINRDFMEPRAALDQASILTRGSRLKHQLNPKVMLIRTAGCQRFSDDNERKHARFEAVSQPSLDLGLIFQYRYR